MTCVKEFLDNLDQSNQLTVCMTCAALGSTHSYTQCTVSELHEVRFPVPAFHHPTQVFTDGMLLYPGSHRGGIGLLCEQCWQHLQAGEVPPQVLSNGFWIGELPGPLESLTLTERILVTR